MGYQIRRDDVINVNGQQASQLAVPKDLAWALQHHSRKAMELGPVEASRNARVSAVPIC